MTLVYSYISSLIFPFIILLCTFTWYYKTYVAPYKELPTIPFMATLKCFLITQFLKDIPVTSRIFQYLVKACKEFQSEGLCLIWFFHPYVIIFSEEAVKLFSREKAALNKSQNYNLLQEVLGNGLITSNGNFWRKQRKIFNPVFNMSALKDKVPIINKHARVLAEELMKELNKPLNIHKHLKFCTFANICESIIGLNVKERKAEVEHIIALVDKETEFFIERLTKPWLYVKCTLHLFPSGRQHLKDAQEIRNFLTKVLLEIKESTLSRQSTTQRDEIQEFCRTPRRSFAQILMEHHQKDPSSFNFEYMIDELTTFVLAGYDSVSQAIMWCIFLLGHHQEVQDQVCNELESVAEGDLSFDDLQKLTYMECVIMETLRLYTIAPLHARRLEENVQCGKYNIPKDTVIAFFPYLYHRDPKIYPDPEKFDPERFLKGGSENRPWTNITFSEGPRNCIGKKFALMEIKIVLAHILRNFKVISLDRREDIMMDWKIILTTVKPLHVHLTSRKVSSSSRITL